jgi:lysophospholipase L1-like esterase
MVPIALVFVGDSDIARWPPSHLPSFYGRNKHEYHYAHCGAHLKDLSEQVKRSISEITESLVSYNQIIFIACAGENDLSSCTVDEIVLSFRKFIDSIFESSIISCTKRVFFFGPKLEPWLKDDTAAWRSYFQLSERIKQLCNKEENNVHFIDCLTMFCSNDTKPKSVIGGEAKADSLYFEDDGLHLNMEGYILWKKEIEALITKVL